MKRSIGISMTLGVLVLLLLSNFLRSKPSEGHFFQVFLCKASRTSPFLHGQVSLSVCFTLIFIVSILLHLFHLLFNFSCYYSMPCLSLCSILSCYFFVFYIISHLVSFSSFFSVFYVLFCLISFTSCSILYVVFHLFYIFYSFVL